MLLAPAAPAPYPAAPALSADTLTAPVSPAGDTVTPLPFPEGATKEQVLDVLTLLEARLDNPAASALCALTLGWYLDTLSPRETAALSERIRLLMQRTASSYPYMPMPVPWPQRSAGGQGRT